MDALHPEIILTATHTDTPVPSGGQPAGTQPSPQHISILDLRAVATDIKDTLSAAIAELRVDICALNDRVSTTERVLDDHDLVLQRSTRKIDAHTLQLREVNRHLEDLENRSCRHNLHVWGMPEEVEGERMPQAVVSLFNSVLGRPSSATISFERIQRARGRDTDPEGHCVLPGGLCSEGGDPKTG